MQTIAYKNFFNIIKIAYPFVKSILDEICEMGKREMKAKDHFSALKQRGNDSKE